MCSQSELKQFFGETLPEDLSSLMFQHSSRHGESAKFLRKERYTMVQASERSLPTRDRK